MPDRLGLVEQNLRRALTGALGRGWRVVDIVHGFRKRVPALQLDLLRRLDIGLAAWQHDHGLADDEVTRVANRLSTFLDRLPPAPTVEASGAGDLDDRVLVKVRALLAKAESTDFEAEADALTAKAHELMARCSIDAARVGRHSGTNDVIARRVLVDDPYAYQRMVLLTEVATACSCRVLCMTDIGLATVFGMPVDVEATEVLYTSLLLQVSRATLTSRDAPSGVSASKVAAFRRAFFIGFAARVGDRLRELRQRVVDDAGADLLPVLADRGAAVEAAIAAHGGKAGRRRRVSDHGGLLAGDRAGASASLDLPTLGASPGSLTG
jgi:hypothetical protein